MMKYKHSPVHNDDRSGFTIIESLIASLIVTIGLLATLSLLSWSRQHNAREQERARAHQIVSQELEQVRLELFSRLNPGQQISVWDNGTPDVSTDDTVGTLEIIMTDPDTGATLSAPPNPAKRICVEVTLSWRPRGRSQAIVRESVMTYLSP